MCPTPLPFEDAIATVNSRAVAVSAWITLDATGQICGFRDVFKNPIYETARDRVYTLNKAIWDAQGGNSGIFQNGRKSIERLADIWADKG